MVEQNLTACLILSALGGLTATLGAAVILWVEPPIVYDDEEDDLLLEPDEDDPEDPKGYYEIHPYRWVGYALNIVFQGLTAVLFTYAPIYGPVSIYRPTALASKLLSNLVIIGALMKRA